MNIEEVLKITNGKLTCGDIKKEINNISIDSRTIKENDLFIGIKGEKYDGNTFYLEAIKKGASVVIDNINYNKEKEGTIILVKNSLESLQTLAKYMKEKKNVKVVGIIGSVGKTTTKDIIYNMLSTKYKVLKTEGNLNGQIGLPLTVLKLKDEEILVVEMGINEKNGMEKLASIVKPDILVITNIGTSHIGNFKTKENILEEKLKVLKYMNGNTIILNNDDELLRSRISKLKNYNIITCGIENKSKYKASNIEYKDNKTIFKVNDIDYQTNLLGRGNIYNLLEGIAVSDLFKIEAKENIIKNMKVYNKRLEIIKKYDITIINDSYNASYESMINSIDVLKKIKSKRKIAVLGDILELGEKSKTIHEELGKKIKDIDILITVGEASKYIYNETLNIEKYHYKNIDQAIKQIKKILKKEDSILIKASHAMNFQKITDSLCKS